MGRDVAAFTLGYYFADYRMISPTAGDRFEMIYTQGGFFENGAPGLYNGNIRHAQYTIAKLNEKTPYDATIEGYTYKYDQLNRLRSQRAYNTGYSYSSFAWVSSSVSTMFQEDATYDPNGNILTYYRRGNTGTPATVMDNLTYQYGSHDNKLLYIDDAQTNTAAYVGDLEDQASGNYAYDPIGNLTQDVRDSIDNIAWTNYQKISAIEKTDRTIRFRYNPMQQRVAKYVKPDASTAEKRTYYVRDAQGNVLAAYSAWVRDSAGITWDSFALAEQHIYGSSRVGYTQPGLMLYPTVPVNPHALDSCHYVIFEGWKRYEISNHLGNVLAVVTDRKRGRASSGTNIQWFVADVLSAQQYYPFGMLMPGNASTTLRRQYSLGDADYRYGFNGKEGDDEVKGDDNQQDYGMRIYDPRVSRFLSTDPLIVQEQLYPELSPYQFASLNPIQNIDIDGLEGADAKYENAHSMHFVGGAGMAKADKVAYDEAFQRIVMPAAEVIGSEIPANALLNWGKAIYRAFRSERVLQKAVSSEKVAEAVQQIGKASSVVQKEAVKQSEKAAYLGNSAKTSPLIGENAASKAGQKAANGGGHTFRYMTENELKAIQQTGMLRGGNPGKTYFTKDLYKSGADAQQRLSLPTKPTLRVEFKILNNPTINLKGSKVLPDFGMPGKGSEFMTTDPVKVKLINWQPLK